MAMHHRAGVRPRAVDLAMDVAFEVDRAAASVERIAVEAELHDVFGTNQRRRDTAREQESIARRRMADAHMSESIDHALVEQDMVRGHEVVDHARGYFQRRHCRSGVELDVHVFDLRGVHHFFDRLFPSYARLFVTAERSGEVMRARRVDPYVTGFNARGGTMRGWPDRGSRSKLSGHTRRR